MTEVAFGAAAIETYNSFISSLPPFAQTSINLFLLVLVIAIYSIFVWNFYRFIATKNILGLNLNKYNKTSHPLLTKLFAGGLYFLEYIIILPFVIFFWFGIFTIFLMLLTENIEIQTLLLISATIVAAIRMTSYYKEELARDLAKLLPFTLLAIAIITTDITSIFERIIIQFREIPTSLSSIVYYLLFIIILEIILRIFDFIFSLFGLSNETVEPEEN